ncbi:uncharacterized protein LOC126833417 isoform X1 [Adelges cooleyi]|uniref:uncharacterized protein LOC126833417 isoform X1 n=1 Tax=Adelges cooleyi TaxID=133065 RepID=UPI0021805C6F|nr:uncharacterized protein LOC126833417 isoform X1 [Adelges cooleyi]
MATVSYYFIVLSVCVVCTFANHGFKPDDLVLFGTDLYGKGILSLVPQDGKIVTPAGPLDPDHISPDSMFIIANHPDYPAYHDALKKIEKTLLPGDDIHKLSFSFEAKELDFGPISVEVLPHRDGLKNDELALFATDEHVGFKHDYLVLFGTDLYGEGLLSLVPQDGKIVTPAGPLDPDHISPDSMFIIANHPDYPAYHDALKKIEKTLLPGDDIYKLSFSFEAKELDFGPISVEVLPHRDGLKNDELAKELDLGSITVDERQSGPMSVDEGQSEPVSVDKVQSEV